MWSTRQFSKLQSGVAAFTRINMEGMENGHILQYEIFGEYCPSNLCTVFKDKFIFVHDMKHSLTLVFGTVLIGWNQMHIFDNDNFSIIPKSIFFDNDNLQVSCKNAIYRLSIIISIISPTPRRVAQNKGRKINNLPIFIRSFQNSGIESMWYKAARAGKTKITVTFINQA